MKDPLDLMRSLLIDKINHTNPKSSYSAQGSCSHQQDRRGVCLLEMLQRRAQVAVLGWECLGRAAGGCVLCRDTLRK